MECSWRMNGWSSAMISRMVGVDALEVVVAEVGPARQLEVVVEAVLDDRADGEVGAGPQPEHGLGQHVGGRVAQDGAAGLGVGGDDADRAPSGSGASRSTSAPSKVAATAALASRGPMDSANWRAVVPASNSLVDPSGSRTVTAAMGLPFCSSVRGWSRVGDPPGARVRDGLLIRLQGNAQERRPRTT